MCWIINNGLFCFLQIPLRYFLQTEILQLTNLSKQTCFVMLLVILHQACNGASQTGPGLNLQTTNSLRSRTRQEVSMVDTLARQPIILATVLRLWCFWTCIVSVKHLPCFVISNQQTTLKRLRWNTPQYQASWTCIRLLQFSSRFYYLHDPLMACLGKQTGQFVFLVPQFIIKILHYRHWLLMAVFT